MTPKKKILLVEDDPGTRVLIEIALREENYTVFSAENTAQVLDICNRESPDLMLLDYLLGNETAEDVINIVREKGMSIPFIILTGLGDQKMTVEMMKMGAIDFMIKEVSFLEHLPATIKKAFKNIEIQQRLDESRQEVLRSEKKYRRIFENIQDIYFETDKNFILTEVSPSVEKIFNMSIEDLSGRNVLDFIDMEEFPPGFGFDFLQRNGNGELEVHIKDNNGERRQFSIHYKVIDDTVVGSVRDTTLKRKLQEQLMRSVVETEEKERKRYSEELHDGLGPLMSGIKMYLDLLNKNGLSVADRKEYHLQTGVLLDQAVSNIRQIANNLTPAILNDFGLKEAITAHCERISRASNIKINLDFKTTSEPELSVNLALYRIIQELINNTLKHAKALNISIRFRQSKSSFVLFYTDDGAGFDTEETLAANKGLGLRNIQSRTRMLNASMVMDTKPGKGFKIKIISK